MLHAGEWLPGENNLVKLSEKKFCPKCAEKPSSNWTVALYSLAACEVRAAA